MFVTRTGGTPLRHVMECHDLHARGAYAAARPGMGCGDLPGSDSCLSSARLFPSAPVSFHPPRRRRTGIGATLLSRAFACGRGRVSAPARFARLIARARGGRRTHFACRLKRGRSAPGRRGREAAPDATSLGPIIAHFLKMQVKLEKYYINIMNNFSHSFPGATKRACRIVRPGRRTPRIHARRDVRLWRPGDWLRQRTSTFNTRAAALSPAAQPVNRP